jgi:hypothetical protein
MGVAGVPRPKGRAIPDVNGLTSMDESDVALRNATYRRFVDLGRAPTAAEIGRVVGADAASVLAGWHRLHDEHALVLNRATDELRMLNPFSAVPTAHRVRASGRWWYGNCAWDAFGICAALHVDGRIETSCPDCGEPLSLDVRIAKPDRTDLLFHCLVPAHAWWNDVVYT